MLRPARPDNAPSICAIYNHYVLSTHITFEENPVAPEEMRERILSFTRTLPWLVWEQDANLIGYAYAGKWRERSAYRFTVEATVYLHPSSTGKGIGSALL
jgi:L-amino acid N-acyltransferase YncA